MTSLSGISLYATVKQIERSTLFPTIRHQVAVLGFQLGTTGRGGGSYVEGEGSHRSWVTARSASSRCHPEKILKNVDATRRMLATFSDCKARLKIDFFLVTVTFFNLSNIIRIKFVSKFHLYTFKINIPFVGCCQKCQVI